jgi:hypothetical protein
VKKIKIWQQSAVNAGHVVAKMSVDGVQVNDAWRSQHWENRHNGNGAG